MSIRRLVLLTLAASMSAVPAFAEGNAPTPKLADPEVEVSLATELSSDANYPIAFVARVMRTEWLRTGDQASATARFSRLSKELALKYGTPADIAGFRYVSHELNLFDTERYIADARTFRTSQAAYRNLYTRKDGALLWGGGFGAEAFRLETGQGSAPFLVDYTSRQGRTSNAIPLMFFAAHDTRLPDAVLPQGHFNQFMAEWGTPAGSMEYTKFDFVHESHFVLAPRLAVSVIGTLGAIDGLGGDYSPLSKRYFGGGVGSVRGYEAGLLGPADESGAVTGANRKATATGEILWHAFNIGATPVILSAFSDWGRFNKADYATREGVSVSSYGLGISLPVKIGLVRFSFAQPKDDNQRVQRFQFEARASW